MRMKLYQIDPKKDDMRLKYRGLKEIDEVDPGIYKKVFDAEVDVKHLKELYDLWYKKQEQLTSIYKTEMPERVPLSENPVFNPLRNYVLHAAGEIEMEDIANEQKEGSDEDEKIDLGGSKDTKQEVYCEKKCDSRREVMDKKKEAGNVALVTTRLLNNVSRLFRDQFKENPQHKAKVDRNRDEDDT